MAHRILVPDFTRRHINLLLYGNVDPKTELMAWFHPSLLLLSCVLCKQHHHLHSILFVCFWWPGWASSWASFLLSHVFFPAASHSQGPVNAIFLSELSTLRSSFCLSTSSHLDLPTSSLAVFWFVIYIGTRKIFLKKHNISGHPCAEDPSVTAPCV